MPDPDTLARFLSVLLLCKKAIKDYIERLSRIFMYLAKLIPDLSYANTPVLGIDFKYMYIL